jgi:cell division protein ZapA
LHIPHALLHKPTVPDVQTSGSTREQVRDLLEKVDLVLATDTPGTPDSTRG